MKDTTDLILRKPFHKRWPGQHAFKTIVYSPDGGRLAMEFPTDVAVAAVLTKVMVQSVCNVEPSPKLLELFEQVTAEIDRIQSEART